MRGAGGVVCQAARKVREATAAQRRRWKVSTPPPAPSPPGYVEPRGLTSILKGLEETVPECSLRLSGAGAWC